VSLCIDALGDKDYQSRGTACGALIAFGADAVPSLIQALNHQDPIVRDNVVAALSRIGPAVDGALEALARALDDPAVAYRAACDLGDMGSPGLPVLVHALKSGRLALRQLAAGSLAGRARRPSLRSLSSSRR